jgi:SAM-dependent methyltransferase
MFKLNTILQRLSFKDRHDNSRNIRFMDVSDYDNWYYNRPQAKAYLEDKKISINLVDMIVCFEPGIVLEFGSGLGHVLKEASTRGIKMIGCDTSEYAVNNSICKTSMIKIGEIPEHCLPFLDNTFDLVFSSEVMEHVKQEHTNSVIRELYRICRKHLFLTINTFDANQPGHINMHARDWWVDKFKTVGFAEDGKKCEELNKMKYLGWDIFVFKKKPE